MMRKIFCVLMAVCMLLALPVTAEETADNEEKLVTMGDSITEGYGMPGFAAGSGNYQVATYGTITGMALGFVSGESYLNLAVSGHTSEDLRKVVADSGEKLKGATVVCISIGGNDILHAAYAADYAVFGQNGVLAALFPGYPGTTAGEGSQTPRTQAELSSMLKILGAQMRQGMPAVYAAYRENMRAVVAGIRAAAPSSRIILQTVYDPFLCTDPTEANYMALQAVSAVDQPFIVGLNEIIRALAGELSFEVIDVYAAFTAAGGHPMTNILQNDIHPNEKGHETIAALLLTAIFPTKPEEPTEQEEEEPDSGDVSSEAASETVSPETSEGVSSEKQPTKPAEKEPDFPAWKTWLGCGLIALAAVVGCTAVVLIHRKRKQ